jgi:predicted transposase YdaD
MVSEFSVSAIVLPNTLENRHEFRVVRLWEQETEPFLQSTGLLPYAALTDTDDRERVLREVARKIDEIDSRREQRNLMTIAAVMGSEDQCGTRVETHGRI